MTSPKKKVPRFQIHSAFERCPALPLHALFPLPLANWS
jgi:hypothetical protein